MIAMMADRILSLQGDDDDYPKSNEMITSTKSSAIDNCHLFQ
jgi:hypothetical protein